MLKLGTKSVYFGKQTFLPSAFGVPLIKDSWMKTHVDKW